MKVTVFGVTTKDLFCWPTKINLNVQLTKSIAVSIVRAKTKVHCFKEVSIRFCWRQKIISLFGQVWVRRVLASVLFWRIEKSKSQKISSKNVRKFVEEIDLIAGRQLWRRYRWKRRGKTSLRDFKADRRLHERRLRDHWEHRRLRWGRTLHVDQMVLLPSHTTGIQHQMPESSLPIT